MKFNQLAGSQSKGTTTGKAVLKINNNNHDNNNYNNNNYYYYNYNKSQS